MSAGLPVFPRWSDSMKMGYPYPISVMTESLSVLAKRANLVYFNRPGFIRCTVQSEQPPILAFDFTSAEAAHQFAFEIDVQGVRGRVEIPDDRPETVLQYC